MKDAKWVGNASKVVIFAIDEQCDVLVRGSILDPDVFSASYNVQ
jgi:hypothetical protein